MKMTITKMSIVAVADDGSKLSLEFEGDLRCVVHATPVADTKAGRSTPEQEEAEAVFGHLRPEPSE